MLDVYLIRHGETYCNKEGRHTGWKDYPLDETGYLQADRAGHYFGRMPFDRYYCSDILRTRETFEHIFGQREDCIYSPLLRELNSGNLAGIRYEDCMAQYPQAYAQARKTWNFRCFEGEDMADVYARAQAFLDEMAALPEDVHRVAAVSHGGLIRTLGALVVGGSMPKFPMKVDNCACCVLRMSSRGEWSVQHWNWIAPENME